MLFALDVTAKLLSQNRTLGSESARVWEKLNLSSHSEGRARGLFRDVLHLRLLSRC